MPSPTATLLIWCPDQRGLVAKIADFVFQHNGNIIHADHHTDFAHKLFLSRLEWELDGFDLSREEIRPAFEPLASSLQANWHLHFSDPVPRLAIFVSQQDHCLLDLLWRQQARELPAEIPLIISNHTTLQTIAGQFGIDFYHSPISKETKAEQEENQLQLLQQYKIDLVVLAK